MSELLVTPKFMLLSQSFNTSTPIPGSPSYSIADFIVKTKSEDEGLQNAQVIPPLDFSTYEDTLEPNSFNSVQVSLSPITNTQDLGNDINFIKGLKAVHNPKVQNYYAIRELHKDSTTHFHVLIELPKKIHFWNPRKCNIGGYHCNIQRTRNVLVT
ncbi:MAG: hypothetical protein M1839_003761 [Geoglossum umbratile]|nr:MAG: hypothetical protein M1839_003761 [Geoglossum umbratile]